MKSVRYFDGSCSDRGDTVLVGGLPFARYGAAIHYEPSEIGISVDARGIQETDELGIPRSHPNNGHSLREVKERGEYVLANQKEHRPLVYNGRIQGGWVVLDRETGQILGGPFAEIREVNGSELVVKETPSSKEHYATKIGDEIQLTDPVEMEKVDELDTLDEKAENIPTRDMRNEYKEDFDQEELDQLSQGGNASFDALSDGGHWSQFEDDDDD